MSAVTSASAGPLGLRVGLFFWLVAIVYFTYLFRSFRGKVVLTESH